MEPNWNNGSFGPYGHPLLLQAGTNAQSAISGIPNHMAPRMGSMAIPWHPLQPPSWNYGQPTAFYPGNISAPYGPQQYAFYPPANDLNQQNYAPYHFSHYSWNHPQSIPKLSTNVVSDQKAQPVESTAFVPVVESRGEEVSGGLKPAQPLFDQHTGNFHVHEEVLQSTTNLKISPTAHPHTVAELENDQKVSAQQLIMQLDNLERAIDEGIIEKQLNFGMSSEKFPEDHLSESKRIFHSITSNLGKSNEKNGANRKAYSGDENGLAVDDSSMPRGNFQDPNFMALRHYIMNNRKKHLHGLTRSQKQVVLNQSKKFEIAASGKLLYLLGKSKRPVIYPETRSDRQIILNVIHKRYAHCRRDLMLEKVLEEYYWSSLREDVENFINSCNECQQQGKGLLKLRDTLKQIQIASKSWWLVGMDLIGPMKRTKRGNLFILTTRDYYTKWVEAVAIPDKTALTVAKTLHEHVYCRNGAPHRIITDNGREWCNELNKLLCKMYSIKHSLTRPYTPRCNGMIENLNKTLQAHLKRKVKEYGNDWDTHLNAALFDIRIRPHTATGYSSFELFHSWKLRFEPSDQETAEEDALIELLQGDQDVAENFIRNGCEEMVARFEAVREKIKAETVQNIQKEQLRQKRAFDNRNVGKGASVSRGDTIMFRPTNRRNKFRGKNDSNFLSGTVIEAASSHIRIQHSQGEVTVSRKDVRKPRRPAPLNRSSQPPSPIANRLRRKRKASLTESDGSTLNLQQQEKLEEELEMYGTGGPKREKYQRLISAPVAFSRSSGSRAPRKSKHPRINFGAASMSSTNKKGVELRSKALPKSPEDKSFSPCSVTFATTPKEEHLAGTVLQTEKFIVIPKLSKTNSDQQKNKHDRIGSELQFLAKFFDDNAMKIVWEYWDGQQRDDHLEVPDLPGVLRADGLRVRCHLKKLIKSQKTEFHKRFLHLSADALTLIHWEAWLEISTNLGYSVDTENHITQHVFWTTNHLFPRHLRYSERIRIQYERYLGDESVDAAQILCSNKFPRIAGFRMIASFFHESSQEAMAVSLKSLRTQKQNKCFVEHLARQNGRQMQILFTNGGHYVFATNCHNGPTNRILIYDSLLAMGVDDWFKHQLAAVFRIGLEFEQLNVEWPRIRQQSGVDCGVHAIANMVAYCHDFDPCIIHLDETPTIRRHLITCLESSHMTMFPTVRSSRDFSDAATKVSHTEVYRIHCICRMPLNGNEQTVRCESATCKVKNFHSLCAQQIAKLDKDVPIRWMCPDCSTAMNEYLDNCGLVEL